MYKINLGNNCPCRSKLLLTPLNCSKNRPEPKHLTLAAIMKLNSGILMLLTNIFTLQQD